MKTGHRNLLFLLTVSRVVIPWTLYEISTPLQAHATTHQEIPHQARQKEIQISLGNAQGNQLTKTTDQRLQTAAKEAPPQKINMEQVTLEIKYQLATWGGDYIRNTFKVTFSSEDDDNVLGQSPEDQANNFIKQWSKDGFIKHQGNIILFHNIIHIEQRNGSY